MWRGGGGAYGVAAITAGTARFDDGTVSVPSSGFASALTSGWYAGSSGRMGYSSVTAGVIAFGSGAVVLGSTILLGWSSTTDPMVGSDIRLDRQATGILGVYGTSTAVGANIRRYGGNAGYVEWGSVSENLTLSTSGTTTDTAANLLPANSYIESVTGFVTTTITTATNWALGDPTTAGRFAAANSTMTAGAASVGLVHVDVVGAGGPRQTAAAKVRVTTTGTPGAGAIRLTSYYRTFVAPTS